MTSTVTESGPRYPGSDRYDISTPSLRRRLQAERGLSSAKVVNDDPFSTVTLPCLGSSTVRTPATPTGEQSGTSVPANDVIPAAVRPSGCPSIQSPRMG